VGLSDRDVSDLWGDVLTLDIDAVADRLGLNKFAVFGAAISGPAAIAYAVRNPERVSHLLLWHAWAQASDLASSHFRGLRRLLDANWEAYTETYAHLAFGWETGQPAHRYAALMREGITREAWQMVLAAARQLDVTALLPQVRAPTLVLHRRRLPWLSLEVATGLASHIPNARLAVLEGASGGYAVEDPEAVLAAIDEFLGEGEEAAEPKAPSGLVTILFTDIEGSTTLTQRLGDAKAQELLRSHNTIVRDALKARSGSEVKHTGDGIMASFPSASGAIECAIAIQRALAQHNESLLRQAQDERAEPVETQRAEPVETQRAEPVETQRAEPVEAPLRVRIGLNAGEPVAEDQDLFGTAVQLAARVCAQAEPGQILIPDGVRHLIAGKGFLFSDHGDVVLRGFEDPVRLYEVRWQEAG
jgi:class 3 adenylate cyclase